VVRSKRSRPVPIHRATVGVAQVISPLGLFTGPRSNGTEYDVVAAVRLRFRLCSANSGLVPSSESLMASANETNWPEFVRRTRLAGRADCNAVVSWPGPLVASPRCRRCDTMLTMAKPIFIQVGSKVKIRVGEGNSEGERCQR